MLTFNLVLSANPGFVCFCRCLSELLRRAGGAVGLCQKGREQNEEPLREHHRMYVEKRLRV